MRRFTQLALAVISITSFSYRSQADETLYRVSGAAIQDGAGGQIAKFQRAAVEALKKCGNNLTQLSADGKFGPGTRRAVQSLSRCPEIAGRLEDRGSVQSGAITRELWGILLPGEPLPTVDERTVGLLLAFEATDFNHAEWNFCQNKPLYNPAAGQSRCVSNDARSFLTWGPNGATAGHGREILAIVSQVDQNRPDLIDAAFAEEAPSLRKAIALENRADNSDLEIHLCKVWLDRDRRQAWKDGFAEFGIQPQVQKTYRDLYKSANFDGGKIERFYRLWNQAGLRPTEIDYAFFVDRAAHSTPNDARISAALANAPRNANGMITSAAARRAVSLGNRAGNVSQVKDRLGRDVTFYADAFEPELSREERLAWNDRGRRKASDVGLSDQRPAPSFRAEAAIAWQTATPVSLSSTEREGCPPAVLNPEKPIRN